MLAFLTQFNRRQVCKKSARRSHWAPPHGSQTQTTLDLKPGQHTPQLVLGDQNHIPHHPVLLSERIAITMR